MPNGDDVKERLRKLKARWKQAIETYPSLLKEFPKEPWDDQGNFDPRALEAYKQAEEKTRYTAPPISTTEPPRQPALTQRQSLPEIKYQATTDAPPPTPSEMGRRLFGLKQADPEQRLGIPGTPISIGPRERSWKTDPSIPIWKGVTKGIDVIQKKGVVPTVSDYIRYLPLKFEPEEGWHRYQTRFGSIPYYPKGETTLSFDQYMTPEGKPSMQAISDLVSRMYPNIGVSGTQAARSILSEALNRADIGGDPTDTERAQRVGEQVRAIEEQEGRVLSQAERREVEEKLYKLPPGGRGLAEELPWAFIPAARVMKGAITGTGLLPRAARGALRPMEILEEAATRGLTKTLDLTSRPFKKFWDLQRGRPSATNISDFLTPQRPPVLPTAPAAARVPDAPTRAARIGDDVVFEGADGTTDAGKVIGEGTIEINEVSKPYFTIRTATGEVNRPIESVRLQAVEGMPTTARAAALTPDEVTELGRLKGNLARDEAALEDLLSDTEYMTRFGAQRGAKPRPYSVRYPGRTPGSVGYRPPLAQTTAGRAPAIVDAEDAVKAAREEVADAQKVVDELSEELVQIGPETTRLPKELAGAKPNYNIGMARYTPQFESDVDKALFIVSQVKKSRRDESYMAWLRGQLPNFSEAQLRVVGRDVRDYIKETLIGQPEGNVVIPTSRVVREAVPQRIQLSRDDIQGLKEAIREAKEPLQDAKSALTDARADLIQAKKPAGYTAEEKAYIAAADKLDVEYPKGLRANIQRAQDEISALEARQVAEVAPTTPAARAADVPGAPVSATVQTLGDSVRTSAGKTTFERIIGQDILNKPIQELTIDEANKVSLSAQSTLGIGSSGISSDADRLFTAMYDSGRKRGWVISDDARKRFRLAPVETTAADVPVTPAARAADEAVPGVVGTARAEIDNIISRVPETSVNTTTQGKRSAAAIVRRNFDELLAGGEVKGQAAKVSYIARQTGRSKEEINGLIGRGPTEPPTVGVGDNFTGDSVDELLATHLTPNFVRRAGEWLAGLPGMKSVVKRVFTPASVARITGNEAVAEGYGYRLLQESQQAIASERLIGFATTKADRMLDRTTRIFDVAREGPEKGKVLLVDGSRRAFGDVAENPAAHRAKGLITAEQEKWITDAHEYIDELARNYQLVSGKQLIFKKKREHYWPRFVVKEDGSVGVSSEKVFARQSPGAPRIYETVEDGMEAGKDYMSDPLEQLTAYSRAVSKMTRDSIFEKRLLSKNIILPDGTPQVMAIRRPRGERVRDLPEWQQRRGLGELDISEAARKQLVQPMGLRRGGFLRIAEMLAAVPKMIVTGLFDTGQFFIQGMPLLFYRKGRWGEAVAGSLRTLFSRSPEDYFNHWMRTGYADKIKDASAHGMDVSALSEYYQAAGILGRVPVAGALGRRFGAAFHAYMNVGRVEMYDAMAMVARSKAARSGQSATELERELRRIARIADSIMGGTSTKGLGLSATQRQVENAFLFFAPRYTRSVFGTVSHAAGSGVGAVETRKMLAQMMFGGAAVVAGAVGAIGIAKGKSSEAITKDIEKALDPRSGAAFMSIELGGQYYGIGGGYRAMARLVANVTPGIPGREGRPSPWSRVMEDAAKGKYGDVILRNPIVMFWRSKMAIPTGSLADFIDGEDFIGEEFSLNAFTEDPGRFGRAVMNRTTPFPVQAFIEVLASGSGVGPAVAAGAAEFIGGRQVPVSLVQRREEKEMDLQTSIKDKLDIEGSYEELVDKRGYGDGKAWSTYKDMEESPTRTWGLDPKTRLLIARDPEVSELSQRSREETKRWNPELGNYYEEIDLLFNNEDEKNLGLIQQLNKAWSISIENNDNPGMAYRLARKAIFTKYYTLLQDARSRAEDAGLFRDFDPEGPFAKANDIYNRILFAEDEELIKELVEGSYVPLEPLPGQFNWDEWDRRMNYLVGEFSQEFVNDTKAISREKLPEFERMYRDSVDRISNAGYFDTRDQAAMDLRLSSKWNDYKNLPDGREKERKRDADIKRIEALGKNKRSRLRLDENLESLLQYWGYETKDVNIDLLKPEGVYIGTWGL